MANTHEPKRQVSYSDLERVLSAASMRIIEFNPSRAKAIRLERGNRLISVENLGAEIRTNLGAKIADFGDIVRYSFEPEFPNFVHDYCQAAFKRATSESAAGFDDLKLCLDPSLGEDPFYCITKDERLSVVAGKTFLRKYRIPEADAYDVAHIALQTYAPRDRRGIYEIQVESGEKYDHFNTYIPPRWEPYLDEVPDRLPVLWTRLIDHLIPWKPEQEYFYAWLHDSLVSRAEVFLVLNGNPGIGKGTLKNILFALHGVSNAAEGSRSMLTDKFNSPLFGCTLLYFDEVAYDEATENRLKQMQNNKVPKESKGVDQTRGDRNYASIIIANNDVDDNYLHIESRKFVPLVMGTERLETKFTQKEIETLSAYQYENSPLFNVNFLAQIAKWVLKHGRPPESYTRWKNLDYKGPKFHQLVQTSLKDYQRNLLAMLLHDDNRRGKKISEHEQHGFLWSTVQDAVFRRDRKMRPGFQKMRTFIDGFKSETGKKVFATTAVPKSMEADFWVRVVDKNFDPLTPERLQKIIDPEGLSDDDIF